jgi:hypothetical protein
MGAIARNIANNITTSGVFTPDALDSDSVTGITALANTSDGITLISSQTASASASISFTTGIDATYKAYKFVFVNMHPGTGGVQLSFNLSTNSGSNYNVTKTSTAFRAYHYENDSGAGLDYLTDMDLAQSTAFQGFGDGSALGADNDQSISGNLILFNPASTVYVKHFIVSANESHQADIPIQFYGAGYGNTTSAVNAVQFKMSSGNIDEGTIYLYGIK